MWGLSENDDGGFLTNICWLTLNLKTNKQQTNSFKFRNHRTLLNDLTFTFQIPFQTLCLYASKVWSLCVPRLGTPKGIQPFLGPWPPCPTGHRKEDSGNNGLPLSVTLESPEPGRAAVPLDSSRGRSCFLRQFPGLPQFPSYSAGGVPGLGDSAQSLSPPCPRSNSSAAQTSWCCSKCTEVKSHWRRCWKLPGSPPITATCLGPLKAWVKQVKRMFRCAELLSEAATTPLEPLDVSPCFNGPFPGLSSHLLEPACDLTSD